MRRSPEAGAGAVVATVPAGSRPEPGAAGSRTDVLTIGAAGEEEASARGRSGRAARDVDSRGAALAVRLEAVGASAAAIAFGAGALGGAGGAAGVTACVGAAGAGA